jgi:hypothetical protein
MFPTKADRAAVEKANSELLAARITFTDYDEYRVNLIGGREASAYYTSDLDDALGSAQLIDAEARRTK